MKIILSVLLCVALFSWVGCSSSSTSQPTTEDNYTGTGNDSLDAMSARGLFFDGQTKITVPDADDLYLSGGSFTIQAWVKPTTLTDYFQDIIVKSTRTPDLDFYLGINRYNKFAFQINGALTNLQDEITQIETGRYYHLAAVCDMATHAVTLYVNGIATATSVITGSPVKVFNRLLIGGNNTENLPKDEFWHGAIYNVSLWNRALTKAQIRTLMFNHFQGNETGLIASWAIDEGSGALIKDITGKHDGSVLGTPSWVDMPF